MSLDCPLPVWIECISEAERPTRCEMLMNDLCVLDGEHFFIRGELQIPVPALDESLVLAVWVSLSEKNFRRMLEFWDSPSRLNEPPSFGWFSSQLAGFPDTVNLKSRVHMTEVGTRVRIDIEPTEHPLAVACHYGISSEDLESLVATLIHGGEQEH